MRAAKALLLAASAALFPGCRGSPQYEQTGAAASTPGATSRDADEQFSRLDASGDGRIGRHEAWADSRIETHFGRGDVNQDGILDRSEFEALTRELVEHTARHAGDR